MKSKESKLLTVKEVADLMDISRVHAWRKIKSGEIKATKIGRAYVIKEEDLQGIYKQIKKSEEKVVERAFQRTMKEYGKAIRKLGKT
jgi:excisionase family DNA binding protein